MENEQKESYTEVLTILNYIEKEYKEKVPVKLIDFFERNSSKDYKFDIELSIPLNKQKLKNRTLSLLAMLNLNYWCKTEKEKQELINLYSENERRYQKELCQKYNPNNIFKNNNQRSKIEEYIIENKVDLVEYNESIFNKCINKIKSIFHVK